MVGKHSSRYARLTAAFATSAFALLAMLAIQQHEANTVTASVLRNAATMTDYRPAKTCIVRTVSKDMRKAGSSFRVCPSR